MTNSLWDLPDDSVHTSDPCTSREFVTTACIAEAVIELILDDEGSRRAALLVVDFSRHPEVLAALARFSEPSRSGLARWSWLESLVPSDDLPLWRCDIIATGEEIVTFAIVGAATPEIEDVLRGSERILITAENPASPNASLDGVLVEVPGDVFIGSA